METIINIHDKFFQETFSREDVAKSFLNEYLPEPIRNRVNLDALTISKDSFVDEEFREHASDILYTVPFRGSDVILFIYLLFEHKSYPDKWVALQLLRYLVKIWDQHLKQHPKAKKLPPVFPMVLYHGKTKWHVPLSFQSLIEDKDGLLKSHTPEFSYELYDISHLPDDGIRGAVIGRIVLLILKYIFRSDLQERLPGLISLLNGVADKTTALEILEALLRYVVHATNTFDENDIREIIKKSDIGEEVMQTFIEKYIQQGMQQGVQQGVLEAIELGLTIKFGSDGLKHMTDISRIKDIEKLRAIKDAIKTAANLSDIETVIPKRRGKKTD